jgi:hypothetical protein
MWEEEGRLGGDVGSEIKERWCWLGRRERRQRHQEGRRMRDRRGDGSKCENDRGGDEFFFHWLM